jgi:transcriptional regulator with XRE-family HTH domain
MPEPLWKIRQRKGMSVNQLAAKSGVPAISISEYESGQAIRSADLPKLAKALYVEEWEVEIKGQALSRPKKARTPSAPPSSEPQPKPTKPAPAKAPRPQPPARPSQIEHLLNLTTGHFDKDRAALEDEVGKPLEELTKSEASALLNHYQKLLTAARASQSPGEDVPKRRRAYLPEGVDEFELEYLTAQQEAGTALRFTLFDGRQLSGEVIGFGPYSITIREAETEDEVTLQKLAIAYYRAAKSPGDAAGQPGGDES